MRGGESSHARTTAERAHGRRRRARRRASRRSPSRGVTVRTRLANDVPSLLSCDSVSTPARSLECDAAIRVSPVLFRSRGRPLWRRARLTTRTIARSRRLAEAQRRSMVSSPAGRRQARERPPPSCWSGRRPAVHRRRDGSTLRAVRRHRARVATAVPSHRCAPVFAESASGWPRSTAFRDPAARPSDRRAGADGALAVDQRSQPRRRLSAPARALPAPGRRVRDAPVQEIEEAIRPGGISKVKSARIAQILAALPTDADGAPTLAALPQMPVDDARAPADSAARRRPQDGRLRAPVQLRDARRAGRHPRRPRLRAARAAAGERLGRRDPRRDAGADAARRRARAARQPAAPRAPHVPCPAAALLGVRTCAMCPTLASRRRLTTTPAAPDRRYTSNEA